MEDSIRYLIAQKRQARRWRLIWVWTFGLLLVAIIALELVIYGKATL